MKPMVYDGILARPGIHKNPRTGKDEIITAEELRKQNMLYKRFPIIVNQEAHRSLINPKIAVGFVESTMSDDDILRAKYTIFREKDVQERIPESIKQKLAAGTFVPASMTYTASLDEQGVQRGRKPDHILIGAKQPMHDNVGIHAEEELPENLRWESTDGIGEDKPDPKPEPKIELSETQLQSIVDKAVHAALEARPPVEAESPKEEPKKEEVPKEEPAPTPTAPVPDVGLPASAPAPAETKTEGLEVLDDGWWKIGG